MNMSEAVSDPAISQQERFRTRSARLRRLRPFAGPERLGVRRSWVPNPAIPTNS
jgi:hypothetical protein